MGWAWDSWSPARTLALIVAVRLFSVFIVQTWYVPDEYWQSLEVAHHFAFGYGELTWEWATGVRSYLYPALFTALYKALYYTGLDYAELVITVPRVLQALLSASGDYAVYRWCGRRRWALFLTLGAWFWFYCGSRTLANTFETALFSLGLSVFPFDAKKSYYAPEDMRWLWLAVLSCHVRPTAAVLWVPLVLYNLATTRQSRVRLLLYRYFPITLITLSALTGLDSYFHGSLVFTPWEFFKANILKGVGSFYGEHPWYWYLSVGLPVVLGVNLVPALWAAATALRRPAEHTTKLLLLGVVALHVAVLSVVPHKEFRFLLPLLPIFVYLSQDVLVQWSRKAKKWQIWAVIIVLTAGNVAPGAYVSLWHQRGTLDVMPLLRDVAASAPHNTSISFLMPCHSTPLYSHLHTPVKTRYLSCEPPLESIGEVDESERFHQNPARWWSAEHAASGRARPAPSHVLLYDATLPRLQAALRDYRVLHELPHTQFPQGYVSEKVLVLERIVREAKPPAAPARDNVV